MPEPVVHLAPLRGWRNRSTGLVHLSNLCPVWERVETGDVEDVTVTFSEDEKRCRWCFPGEPVPASASRKRAQRDGAS
jgi:hypothetical protein